MWGVGDLPHGQPHNIRPAVFGLYFGLMKTTSSKAALTFGGLIENFYNAYGERNAKGVLRLAFRTNLVVFRGRNRCVVSRATGKA
jgi:hypothetical protein